MSFTWSSSRTFTNSEDVDGFSCGLPAVDAWLHGKALQARPNVKTTLFLKADDEVVAFMATRMIIVDVKGGNSANRAGSDREGMSTGFLLAQMGVRQQSQGIGIGKAVIRAAIDAAIRSYIEAPFQLFVVDSENEALIAYYEQFGFKPLLNDLRLVAPMRKILRATESG